MKFQITFIVATELLAECHIRRLIVPVSLNKYYELSIIFSYRKYSSIVAGKKKIMTKVLDKCTENLRQKLSNLEASIRFSKIK